MTTAVAIAVVLLVLVATHVWVHLGPGQVHVVTGPLAALLLLVLARMAGLTWQELGLGRQTLVRGLQVAVVAVVVVAIVYAVAVAIPFTRGAFRDTRYRIGPRAVLYTAFLGLPCRAPADPWSATGPNVSGGGPDGSLCSYRWFPAVVSMAYPFGGLKWWRLSPGTAAGGIPRP